MKNLHIGLFTAFITLAATVQSFGQISMTFPKATTYIDSVSVGWSTSNLPASIQMIWTYNSGHEAVAGTVWTLTLTTTASSGSFKFNPLTVTSNANFSSVSPNTAMPDGIWSVKMLYSRASDGAVFSSSTVTLSSSTHTLAAIISRPTANSSVSALFNLKDSCYSLPALSHHAKKIMFARGTDTTFLYMTTGSRNDSITLNINNLLASSASIDSVAPAGAVLTEGVYDVLLSYMDSQGHPAAVTTNQNVTVDLHTQAPSISNADASDNTGHIINLNYTLPETALAGSVGLRLTHGTTTDFLVLSTTSAGAHSISIDFNNIAATPNLISSTASTLPSGSYTVGIQYQDVLVNPAASATGPTLTVITVTPTPTINAPASGTVSMRSLHIDFTLPSTALAGSVKLLFAGSLRNDTIVLTNTTSTSFDLNTTNITGNSNVASSTISSLPDGSYTLTVYYQDYLGNLPASASVTGIVIDGVTQAPVLISPSTSSTGADNITVSYTLPENALSGSVKLEFLGCTPVSVVLSQETAGTHTITINGNNIPTSAGVTSSTASTLSQGSYGAVALSYQDAASNTRAYTLNNNFTFSSTLPLTLNELKGALQGTKTLLLWDTFSESNTDFFDVEYSTNASNFKKVGEVAAAGNSSAEKDYKFIHTSPIVGDNYYRLRMVDKDGAYKYSEIIVVYMDKGKMQFKIFPNPARDQINVMIVSGEDSKSHMLKVWDNSGRIVKQVKVTPIPGSNLFTVPMSDLLPGTYLMQDGDNIASFVKL